MKEIKFVQREEIKFTFAKDEIRIKAPEFFVIKNRDFIDSFTRKMENIIYKDFKYTLRGSSRLDNIQKDKFSITLYTNTKKSKKQSLTFYYNIFNENMKVAGEIK